MKNPRLFFPALRDRSSIIMTLICGFLIIRTVLANQETTIIGDEDDVTDDVSSFQTAEMLTTDSTESLPNYIDGENVTIHGASFQTSGVSTTNSFLRYKGSLPNMTSFTICFRIFIQQFRMLNTIMSYAIEDDPSHLSIYITPANKLEVICCDKEKILSVEVEWKPMIWQSICLSVNLPSGLWDVKSIKEYYQGDISNGSSISDPVILGGGMLFIGQDQQVLGGGFTSSRSLRAKVMDFQLYDDMLFPSYLAAYIYCQVTVEDSQEPLIDFKNIEANFETREVELESADLTYDPFCKFSRAITIPFAILARHKDATQICKSTGGSLTIPESDKENADLFEIASPFSERCGFDRRADTFWLRPTFEDGDWFKEPHTRDILCHFRNLRSCQILYYSNFNDQMSHADEKLCSSLITVDRDKSLYSGKWTATRCTVPRCFACSYWSYPEAFYLHGLCKETHFDNKYLLIAANGSIFFQGFYSSMINYIPVMANSLNRSGYWELSSFDFPEAKAKLWHNSDGFLPIGRNSWHFYNDECGKDIDQLLLTYCSEGQFTCNDMACINGNFRCDMYTDCNDESDERDCQRVKLPEFYDSTKVTSRIKFFRWPSELGIQVKMFSIKEFNLSKFLFTSEIRVDVTWYDERLQFLNLQRTKWVNKVSEKIGEPPIEFLGHENTTCDVQEHSRIILVNREQEGTIEQASSFEDLLYQGFENALHLERKLTVKTTCLFKLFAFPFDVQHCALIMKLSYPPKEVMSFIIKGDGLTFEGERNLLQYHLREEKMTNKSIDGYSSVQIDLVFSNLTSYYITSTYLPTLILLIISYLTFFFALDDFNDRIMVTLTGLLVEAAFFTQTSASVPKTAYLKLLDIWFVFCIVFLFMMMVTILIIDMLRRLEVAEEEEPQERSKAISSNTEEEEEEVLHEPLMTTASKSDSIDQDAGKISARSRPRISAAAFNIFLQCKSDSMNQDGRGKSACSKPRISASNLNLFCKMLFPIVNIGFVVSYFVYAVFWAPYL